MITRVQAVKIANDHFDNGTRLNKNAWHYGRVEVRELLDAIYGGPPDPSNLDEHIKAN